MINLHIQIFDNSDIHSCTHISPLKSDFTSALPNIRKNPQSTFDSHATMLLLGLSH